MMKTWNHLFILCLTLTLIGSLNLAAAIVRICPNTYPEFLNNELTKAVSKPNRWGYTYILYPDASDWGLTYWVQATIALRNVRLESTDEAEELFVDIYKDFIRDINKVRAIRPYLAEFPLTPSTCEFCIRFDNAQGKPIFSPYFFALNFTNEKLEFGTYEALNRTTTVIPKRELIYRSAHDIPGIEELYQPKCPRSPCTSKIQLPGFSSNSQQHLPPLVHKQIAFIQKLCEKTDLVLTTVGCVGQHYFDDHAFEFALRGSQSIKLDEARKISTTCGKELLDFVAKNQDYRDYIKKRSTWPHEKNPSPTPVPEQFAYRISFWDENIDRPVAPNIAEVRLLNGKLSYFTADENQRLELVFEETFEESLKGQNG